MENYLINIINDIWCIIIYESEFVNVMLFIN